MFMTSVETTVRRILEDPKAITTRIQAVMRSVICSGSFVGCGSIQEETTEIVNRMARQTTGTSKAT